MAYETAPLTFKMTYETAPLTFKMTYETTRLTLRQAKEFYRRFNLEIGTECEFNNIDTDTYCVCCFGLGSRGEVNACRKFELASLRMGE